MALAQGGPLARFDLRTIVEVSLNTDCTLAHNAMQQK